jgi:hypothetical protein
MRLLIEWKNNGNNNNDNNNNDNNNNYHRDVLLAPDTSFGDLRTPLHKAAAGGRYLAVQLLLDALRDHALLHVALATQDHSHATPLRVAQQLQARQRDERQSVARWDQVAGGVADWTKCVALLEAATATAAEDEQPPPPQVPKNNINNNNKRTSTPKSRAGVASDSVPASASASIQGLPALPAHLTLVDGCLDCGSSSEDGNNNSGACLTASWQASFQAALGTSVDLSLQQSSRRSTGVNNSNATTTAITPMEQESASDRGVVQGMPPPPSKDDPSGSSSKVASESKSNLPLYYTNNDGLAITKEEAPPKSSGVSCSNCGKTTIALYPAAAAAATIAAIRGRLICKSCKRKEGNGELNRT